MSKSSQSSFDLYQVVTDQIVSLLDNGTVPWRCPIMGRPELGRPKNLASGRGYRGLNVFLLAMTSWVKGYESSYWLTFNQAKEKGGAIRKGEKSSLVIFWKQMEIVDEATKEAKRIPVLRHYNVFNVCQCDNIAVPDAPTFTPSEFTPVEEAQKILTGYSDSPEVEHTGSSAFYSPSRDVVRIADPTRFVSTNEYYSTLFHELIHSTGHSTRLDRGLDTDLHPFGSPDYSREELVAEMGAAFLSAHSGIAPVVLNNQAAYLAGWLKALKGDKRLVVVAAGAAQRAADWILGNRQGAEEASS